MFLEEVRQFITSIIPSAAWETGNGYAVLFPADSKKSICFLSNDSLDLLHDSVHRFYITEFQWQKNMGATMSRLSSILGNTNRIFARQCSVSTIDKKIAHLFTNENHIMGYANSAYHYGLFYKNELIAVACFSKGMKMDRLPGSKKSFELIRFCSKNFHTVVGGLSKLLHSFTEEKSPGDIMTYIDVAWGEPFAFYALGFLLDKITPPFKSIILLHDKSTLTYINKGNYKLIKHLV